MPMNVAMKITLRIRLIGAIAVLALLLLPTGSEAQVQLQYNVSAVELSEAITGDGVQILNPQLICADSASGGYSVAGIPGLPDGEGIILTTGNIGNMRGPNNTEASTVVNNFPGDPLITQIAGNSSFDACALEFDVVPVGDTLRFDFTFASEEYDEYVGTPFNDFFGFFISGPGIVGDPGLNGLENIAVIPGTNQPVNINTVNNGNPDLGIPPTNALYYVENPLGFNAPIQYDGWTRGLSAVKQVTPCDTFSVRLVIADVADPEWDSAVLIERIQSNSISLSHTNVGNLESTIEGCNDGTVTFTRTPVTSEEAIVTFFVDGSATNGMDYSQIGSNPDPSIPKTVTIPANQASVSIDIIPLDDGIGEGEEYIDIYIGNPNCTGTIQDSIRVFINDSITVSIDPPLAFVCADGSLTFSVDADENADYSWSPSDYLDNPNTKEPTTSPLLDIDYLLTVSAAACQSTALAEIRVSDVELTFSSVNIDCASEGDGSIDLTISGGESPYEIQWSGPNGFTSFSEDIDNLTPGLYVVLVIDRDGCTEGLTVEITENPVLELELNSDLFQGGFNVSCPESNDGQATVLPNGGTPPYTFLWNDQTAQTTQTASNLTAGAYEVSVTDANECAQTGSITLLAPQPITATLEERNDVFCKGSSTGEATVSPVGGVAPYTVIWNTTPPQFGPTADGLAVGIYTASITDINGCQGTTEIEISEPAEALDGSIISSNVTCNGSADGTATSSISGGTPPYSYEWSAEPGLDESFISDIPGGNYTLTVTDENDCTLEIPFLVSEPLPLEINLIVQADPTCAGAEDGGLVITATGGTGAYVFTWNTDPIQTGSELNDLAAGTYTVTATDGNNCATSETYEIIDPSETEINLVAINSPSCSGLADGSIEVEAFGGTGPYTFSWNTVPPTSGPLVENLGNGLYTVTATDLEGCEILETFEIEAPTPIEVELISIENVLCNGGNTGTIQISVSGGTSEYSIAWNDPANQTGLVATNLSAGTYTAFIEDANGCTIDFEVVLTEPDLPLDAEITSQSDALCFGDESGSATVSATGGSGSYSYQWDDPAGQQTASANSLLAGEYTVTVFDNNGCATPVVVSVTIGGPAEALVLELTPSAFGGGFAVACAEDSTASIDMSITGGTAPYEVLWNLPGLDISTDEDISELAPGFYSVTVTDDNGCEANAEITISAPTPISIESTSTPSFCLGISTGSIDITISGGVPNYTANWAGPSGFTGVGTSLSDLEGGVYIVTIEDSNGCVYVDAVTVNQPDDLVITVDSLSDYNGFNTSCINSSDGEIYITPSGGTAPYSYQWNTPGNPIFSNQQDVINLSAGIYQAVLIDDNGCIQSEAIELVAPDTLQIDFVLSEYLNGFNISCFGAADGSIEAVPANGSAPFTFIWIGTDGYGPVFSNPIENLDAGEYSLLIQDAGGCSTIETVSLSQPDEFEIALVAETINGNNISCQGASDGSINLIVEGGNTPFSISWTGPDGFTSSDEDIFELAVGEYCVSVTDDNDCSQEACITLSEPDAIAISLAPFQYVSGFNLTCAGADDGSIDATISGGTSPIIIQWTGPNGFTSTNENIEFLAEGEYCLTVTDVNGCADTECIVLTSPENVQIELDELVGSGCSGGTAGSIGINIIAGNAPFNINWTGPDGYSSSSEDLTDLQGGVYCVQVSDANGCQGEACYTVLEPEEIAIVFTTSSFGGNFEVDCAENSSGFISSSISGGNEPYFLAWTGPDGFTSSLSSIENLIPGTYCLTLTDDNDCNFNECIEIEAPLALAISPVISLPNCGDETLAEVELQISGGVPPYTVNWSNGSNSEIVFLGDGQYEVIISDANNCVINEVVEILLPEPLLLGFEFPTFPGGVNITCNGAATGSIDLTLINATGISSISWIGPNGFSSTDEDLTNLEAGEYCVSVVDGLGCEATECITLIEATEISATFETSSVSCNTGIDGGATITIAGGVPTYNTEWTGPGGFTAFGSTIADLAAGNYCAEVTDLNGCTEVFCLDISEPDGISIALSSPEMDGFNIACFNENLGEIESSISGGTGQYSYTWSGPNGFSSTAENPINLNAGEYCLTITDGPGCAATECITLTEAPGIEFTFDVLEYPNGFNTSCGNDCDGSIDLSLTGGTAPLEVIWTGPPGFNANTEDLSNLCAGTYTAITTDGNGCTQSASVTLSQPSPIAIVLDAPLFGGGFEVSCFGSATGSIATSVSGGEEGVNFEWIGPGGFSSNQQNLENLIAGTYFLTVTDGNDCFSEAEITLSQPAEALGGTTSVSAFPSGANISCTGLNDGSITTIATGGTEPYEFNWNGPEGFTSTDQDVENLIAGSYTLVILDANSCSQTINLTLTEPLEPLTVQSEVTSEILCFGDSTGAVSITASGGSAELSVQWSGPGDFTSNALTLTDLPSGTYTYVVTDANGCTLSEALNLVAPSPIVVTSSLTQPICATSTGIIDVTVTGGTPPYQYLWNTGNTSQDLAAISFGDYALMVIDDNGCEVEVFFELIGQNDLELDATLTNPACFGDSNGAIELDGLTGQEPYTFTWTGPNGFTAESEMILNLGEGTYNLEATDANGCTLTDSFTLTEPDLLAIVEIDVVVYSNGFNLTEFNSANPDGVIQEPSIEGGTSPYSINYSGPEGYESTEFGDIIELSAGWYYITITDANLCMALDSVELVQPEPIELPNGISPNGDGFNDALTVRGLDDFPQNKLIVFNRWGNIVYEEANYRNSTPWIGTNESGEELPEGTYFVVVELVGINNLKGYLELRR